MAKRGWGLLASLLMLSVRATPNLEVKMKTMRFASFKSSNVVALLSGALMILTASTAFSKTNLKPNPERNAYFGELHIHSDWSIDAYVFGTRVGPLAEIKYAMGQPVMHPGGYHVQLKQPLDFTVVMDHSEYMGALAMADNPDSPLRKNHRVVADLLKYGT